MGGGGVDGAIHRAAGPGLLRECRGLGGCRTGEARITKGYLLPAKYVIHTPGPIWRGGSCGEEGLLRASYRNSLLLAEQYACRTVAFPSISTGIYGYPVEPASMAALDEMCSFMASSLSVRVIYIVCFDKKTAGAYVKNAPGINCSGVEIIWGQDNTGGGIV